jgi:hypothetical protein
VSDFLWTKRQILDAVIGRYRRVDADKPETWMNMQILGVWGALALGRPEGRASRASNMSCINGSGEFFSRFVMAAIPMPLTMRPSPTKCPSRLSSKWKS